MHPIPDTVRSYTQSVPYSPAAPSSSLVFYSVSSGMDGA